MFGWFGGYGFEGTMGYFTGTAELPWFVGFLVIILEVLAPIALVIGFATRFWAVAVSVLAAGIILTTHSEYFFMNWFGNQANEGMEYFLLMMGMSVSLVFSGGGSYSLDRWISQRQIPVFKGTFALTNARL